jgi:hypothetical protein
MKRVSWLPVLLLLGACAGLPVLGQWMGPFVSVSVPSEIPFPQPMILELGPAAGAAALADQALGLLGSQSLEQRIGTAVRNVSAPYSAMAAEAFRKELEDSKLFGSVTHGQGTVSISVGISRWGIAYDESTKRLLPVMDLEASLSVPGLGNVWKASRSMKDLGAEALAALPTLSPAMLASNPQGFSAALASVTAQLSRQLVEELRKNPPHP